MADTVGTDTNLYTNQESLQLDSIYQEQDMEYTEYTDPSTPVTFDTTYPTPPPPENCGPNPASVGGSLGSDLSIVGDNIASTGYGPTEEEDIEAPQLIEVTSVVDEQELRRFGVKDYTKFKISTSAQPLPSPVTVSWFPTVEQGSGRAGTPSTTVRKMAMAWKVIQSRGHKQVPRLASRIQSSVSADDLPWASFAPEDWETLFEAYALNDFLCPIEGCEPKPNAGDRGSLPRPWGSDYSLPRDESGYTYGKGLVSKGKHAPSPKYQWTRPAKIVEHWLAWHMVPGLALLLPCPLDTQPGEKGVDGSTKMPCNRLFHGSSSLLQHLVQHTTAQLGEFIQQHDLKKLEKEQKVFKERDPKEDYKLPVLQMAESVRRWLTRGYCRLVNDPEMGTSYSLDRSITLRSNVVGNIIFRREWRYAGPSRYSPSSVKHYVPACKGALSHLIKQQSSMRDDREAEDFKTFPSRREHQPMGYRIMRAKTVTRLLKCDKILEDSLVLPQKKVMEAPKRVASMSAKDQPPIKRIKVTSTTAGPLSTSQLEVARKEVNVTLPGALTADLRDHSQIQKDINAVFNSQSSHTIRTSITKQLGWQAGVASRLQATCIGLIEEIQTIKGQSSTVGKSTQALQEEFAILKNQLQAAQVAHVPTVLPAQSNLVSQENYQAVVQERDSARKALHEEQIRSAKLDTRLEMVKDHYKELEKDLREQVSTYRRYLPAPPTNPQ